MIPQKDRIEAAIRHIQTSVDIDPWAMELAVDALNAQVGQASCEYCHEDSDGYVRPIEKNLHAWLARRGRTMKLRVSFKGEYRECEILFCPMCGRRLNK